MRNCPPEVCISARAHRRAVSALVSFGFYEIVIPVALVEYAKIVKGAVVIGCGKFAEIWSEETYAEMVANENLDDLKNVLESYGL